MSNKKIIVILSLLVFVLFVAPSFCSYEYWAKKLIPEEEAAFAKEYLIRLRVRDFDHIKRYLSPTLFTKVSDANIEEVASYFPEGKLINVEMIGSEVFISADEWQANLSYEFQFSEGWAIANVVLEKIGEQLHVNQLNVYQTIDSQKKLNEFSFHNKSSQHFFVLFLALVIPLLIIVSLFYCIKAPIPKRKWLWLIFVSLGIGSISINWTTGQFWFKLLSCQLLGAGYFAESPYAPWIVQASIPWGAIIFWIKRKKFLARAYAPNGDT
jgi:hypothetical protein